MDHYVTRLRRLDCCAVSDALDKLSLPGTISGLNRQSTSARIAGRVVTYRLVPHDQAPATAGPAKHLGSSAIEMAQPGDVLVGEQRTGIDAGSWGGLLSLGAKMRGIAGVIVDGPARDIDEAQAYGFPVFSRSLTARTARGRVAEADTGKPVKIGDVTVSTGDYVIADGSGVAFIRQEDIERLLDTAEMIARREALMAKALLAGRPISEVMGGDYEHMLHNTPKQSAAIEQAT